MSNYNFFSKQPIARKTSLTPKSVWNIAVTECQVQVLIYQVQGDHFTDYFSLKIRWKICFAQLFH